MLCAEVEADGGQRLQENQSLSATKCSTPKHGSHHANCGLNLKLPDYWISLWTLCNRVLSEPDLRGSTLVHVCLHMWIHTGCFCFSLWTKMITEKWKSSIYWMSHIEWPVTFHQPDSVMLRNMRQTSFKKHCYIKFWCFTKPQHVDMLKESLGKIWQISIYVFSILYRPKSLYNIKGNAP